MLLAAARALPGARVLGRSDRLAGLTAAGVVGVLASVAGHAAPVIGAPVIAVLVGAVASPLVRRRRAALAAGLGVGRGLLLQLAVVLLGAQLSLREVASVGSASLPVMLGTLVVCFAATWLVGRVLGVEGDLRVLIGVGTGICGASAIAATVPVIRAKGNDVAYALSTIFLFNVAAILVFPPLGHALGLSQNAFGLFAGTAVNDLSSVVAASSSYGSAAAQHAVVVKLVRTLMIVPIVLVLSAVTRRVEGRTTRAGGPAGTGGTPTSRGTAGRRNAGSAAALHAARSVPWFLYAFVGVTLASSAGLIPTGLQPTLKQLALVLIAVALASIGLGTDVPALRATGIRPLLLGFVLWIVVAATSLTLGSVVT